MAEHVDLGDLSALADGDVHVCKAGAYDVMVCRVAGRLYAIEDLCSHADTTLSDGLLIGANITCPLHGAQFDVRDGSHKGPPAYTGVSAFAVDEGTGGAFLTIPDAAETDTGSGPPGGYFQTR